MQEIVLRAHPAQACNLIGTTVYALPDNTSVEVVRIVTRITIVLLASSTHSNAQLAQREQAQPVHQIVWSAVYPVRQERSAPATVKVAQVATLLWRDQDTTPRGEQSSSISLPVLQASIATMRRQLGGQDAQSARPAKHAH